MEILSYETVANDFRTRFHHGFFGQLHAKRFGATQWDKGTVLVSHSHVSLGFASFLISNYHVKYLLFTIFHPFGVGLFVCVLAEIEG